MAGQGVSTGVIVCGYIFAFLISIIGLILGIVTLARGDSGQQGHGIAITAISIVSILIAAVFMGGM